MKTNELNILDIFQRELFNYLNQYHTYILKKKDAKDFIVKRADFANSQYQDSISKGKSHTEAMEDANEILFADLEFSPLSYIQDVYQDRGIDLDDNMVMELYEKSQSLFEEFKTTKNEEKLSLDFNLLINALNGKD